jgi:hypothetical protein
MAYTTSGGLKTSATVKAADLKAGTTPLEIIIQNQAAAIMYVKFGSGASATDYDFALKACTVAKDGTSTPIVLSNFDDAQVISAFAGSGTLSYTFSYR